jgi:hypothetical protein
MFGHIYGPHKRSARDTTMAARWQNLGMACNPYTVLTGREPGKDLSAKLKTEAESRRNYKLYIKGSIPEGTPVKVSMRWMVLVV